MRWVQFATWALGPSAAVWVVLQAWRALTRGQVPPWLQPGGRRGRRANGPTIERIGADLHRLSAEIARIEASDQPAKAARMRAVTLAYDDVLMQACRTLQVEVPARPPLDPLERLETEAALAREGLVW